MEVGGGGVLVAEWKAVGGMGGRVEGGGGGGVGDDIGYEDISMILCVFRLYKFCFLFVLFLVFCFCF